MGRWEKGVIMLCTLGYAVRGSITLHTLGSPQPSEEPCIEASRHVLLSSPRLNAHNQEAELNSLCSNSWTGSA